MRRIQHPTAILWLLTALNLLNYLDRTVLAAVLPLVQVDLGLSNTVAGAFGTIFLVGYFVTSPLFGRLADGASERAARQASGSREVGLTRKALMALGVGVWSLATFATGLAAGAWSLAGARAVVGVGEASYATIAPTVIDDMAPPEKKAGWLSIFYVAIPVGSALGYISGGLLGSFGWRYAFWLVGGPGILAALSCLLISEPVPRAAAKVAGHWRGSVRALAAIPIFRRGVLGYTAQTFAVGGFGFWAPKYIVEQYDFPAGKASVIFGGTLVVAGAIGTWLGGFLSDRWVARNRAALAPEGRSSHPAGASSHLAGASSHLAGAYRRPDPLPSEPPDPLTAARIDLRVCAISSAVAAPLAAAACLAPSATGFFVLAFGCEIAVFAAVAPVSAALLRSVPVELRASAMALTIFVIHFFGDLWSPLVLGVLHDVLPARAAMMGVPIAMALSAGLWVPPPAAGRAEEPRTYAPQ